MIKVTRLDGKQFLMNCDLIECIESVPNTVITLRTEKKIIVQESMDEVLSKIISYKQIIHSSPYYSNDDKVYVNSDAPEPFLTDKQLKNKKNIKDIVYPEPPEEDEEEEE